MAAPHAYKSAFFNRSRRPQARLLCGLSPATTRLHPPGGRVGRRCAVRGRRSVVIAVRWGAVIVPPPSRGRRWGGTEQRWPPCRKSPFCKTQRGADGSRQADGIGVGNLERRPEIPPALRDGSARPGGVRVAIGSGRVAVAIGPREAPPAIGPRRVPVAVGRGRRLTRCVWPIAARPPPVARRSRRSTEREETQDGEQPVESPQRRR
jgi:hypothetical protein